METVSQVVYWVNPAGLSLSYRRLLAEVVEGLCAMELRDQGKPIRVYLKDIINGLIKAETFAIIITTIACNEGLKVTGGAQGVGRAATRSVVDSRLPSILISSWPPIMRSLDFPRPMRE